MDKAVWGDIDYTYLSFREINNLERADAERINKEKLDEVWPLE
jgi:hypothetical protein